MGAKSRPGGVDAVIGALAEHQHGVVSRGQLLEAGVGRGAIRHRLDTGRLHRLRQGVYAVGHRVLSREARWMAALLAVGPDAVLSQRSAAALWGIRPSPDRMDVSVPRALPPRSDVRLHRTSLASDERTTRRGIPVTTVARTLLDLAAVLNQRELEKALDEAEIRRLADATSLDDLLTRHPRRTGTKAIRALLDRRNHGLTITRSELEDRFRAFLDDAVLPRPRVNARLELGATIFEVDCSWPEQRLIVELDGHATHATTRAFEEDRARDRILTAHGWRVIRVTWRQLHAERHALAADLTSLLG